MIQLFGVECILPELIKLQSYTLKQTLKLIKMKPTLVADEMFPEGANFMDLDEVRHKSGKSSTNW